MRAVFASLVVLAACGSHSSQPAQPAPEQTSHAAELPPERSTLPPAIAWRDNAFELTGLPAVARAGEVVVVAIRDRDSERGFPNLRIEVRDKHDQVVWTVPVMLPTEYEQLAPGGAASVELAKRIGHANAELQRLHGLHDLVAMHALELLHPADGSPHMATGDGIDVDWDDDHLHVFRHNGDRDITTRDGRGWLEPDRSSCAACEPCHNPAYLAAVFHAPEIQVVLVELGYKGTDACEPPSEQLHVVAW